MQVEGERRRKMEETRATREKYATEERAAMAQHRAAQEEMLHQLRNHRTQFEAERARALGGGATSAPAAPGGKTVHVTYTDEAGKTYQVRAGGRHTKGEFRCAGILDLGAVRRRRDKRGFQSSGFS